ncbi:MAG: hypothetical protein LBC31_05020 [Treponema sp.]|jgi:hypothetical protein|nr:hypothetical protein [Treponema sp.]
MANNARVKLVADLIQAAKERNCVLPVATIQGILNDKHNMAVFGITQYTQVKRTIAEAKKLIQKRKAAHKSLY